MLTFAVVCALVLSTIIANDETVAVIFSIFAVATWLVDRLVLSNFECELRTEAATIQEDFDCFVLDLTWPSLKGIKRPLTDRVRRLAAVAVRAPSVPNELQDWYTVDESEESFVETLQCQRMNCAWDGDLRRCWMLIFRIGIWTVVVVTVVLMALGEVTVGKVGAMAALSIRVVGWFVDEIKGQNEAIERTELLQSYLSGESCGKPRDGCDLRMVQSEIFEHRRSAPPVPDWFHRRVKKVLDERWGSGDRS